jgi:ribose 5-phosphate isomerase A
MKVAFVFYPMEDPFYSEKEAASREALKFVKNKMVVGLGTGSTARILIPLLAERAKAEKLSLTCVATSFDSRKLALEKGLKVVDLDQVESIDVAIDGADVITEELYCLKGGGGALAREKVVGYFADELIIIVDSTKVKEDLSGNVPIEVMPFAYSTVLKELQKKGIHCELRHGTGKCGPVVSDNNNYIIDAKMTIDEPEEMEGAINNIPCVVANGIFTKVSRCVIGMKDRVRVLTKE